MPRPQVNLMCFQDVLVPNGKYRVIVTPVKRGKVNKSRVAVEPSTQVGAFWLSCLKADGLNQDVLLAQPRQGVVVLDGGNCANCGEK